MNLRIKLNTVIIVCCAVAFIIIYINFKAKMSTNYQQELQTKAEFVLNISEYIDQSSLNTDKSVFFAKEILSQSEFKNIHYLVAFEIPINEKYQAKLWQKDIIDIFKQDNSQLTYQGKKSDQFGEFQIISKAIFNSDDDVVGAKFITIYKTDILEKLSNDLNQFILFLIIILGIIIVIFNTFIHYFVIKPIKVIASKANEISRGNKVVEELIVEGKDEISEISHSFNRIIRSLKAAMKLINS